MGSWDCYCMLCCGPLKSSSVDVGDSDAKALRKRERSVRRMVREEKGLDGLPGGDKIEASDEDEHEAKDDDAASSLPKLSLESVAQNELYHGNPYKGMYDYYEEYSYDPRLLTKKDVAWLDRCRTIGFNADTKKAYITGLGTYVDWGDFETSQPGSDPNDPHPEQGRTYPCYMEDGGDIDDPTFPFHETCYAILAKRMGFDDPASITKDVLYKVASALGEGNGDSLRVDYGGEFSNQFWANRPGEEYVVTCPEDEGLDFRNLIWKCMPPSLLLVEPQPDLSLKVQHDPLSILPFDLLCTILQHLSVHDTLNLMQASHHVCTTTREPTFWRSMIRTHIAPWFWETQSLVNGETLQGFDYKGLFLWLDKITEPKLGMQGPFLGVANRRRIWSVCGLVANAYKIQLGQDQEFEAQG
ncbi:hypothetical protein E8E12_000886 [Didymella heteroderae]|uniref:F-box domain-containing protein n=1 Tax=Didymella heteroderae TaxID=1769908 RepID=A0A9P4WPZ1_9PLEO|nr:hypothetical protein E8E12_000886 [Didymella heteroderae]